MDTFVTEMFLVDRSVAPIVMVSASGFKQYVYAPEREENDDGSMSLSGFDLMPRGVGESGQLTFVRFGCRVVDDELDVELATFHRKVADPYAVVAYNKQNPTFHERKPNGTHWKGPEGDWWFLGFNYHKGKLGDEARMVINVLNAGWHESRWFATVPI